MLLVYMLYRFLKPPLSCLPIHCSHPSQPLLLLPQRQIHKLQLAPGSAPRASGERGGEDVDGWIEDHIRDYCEHVFYYLLHYLQINAQKTSSGS